LKSTRIDYLLIWGHGMQYFHYILKDLKHNQNFKILKILKYKPKSIKQLVKKIYSYDYAPYWHLKEKTRYLETTPKEVCFIFIENLDPEEDYLGEGSFRHKESLQLKKFKEHLRDKYNPYENSQRTHNHVIHASDNQLQADYILKFLGFNSGINLFDREIKFIDAPYHIKGFDRFEFQNVSIDKLYCNIAKGKGWDDYILVLSHIAQSPQYMGLKNIKIYQDYINKFIGGPLTDYYDVDKYHSLQENFHYPYNNAYIIVKKENDKFIILDGLHRASICCFNNEKEIKVCIVS